MVKRRKKFFDAPVRDSIPKGLGVSSKRHDPLVAHLGKMLRQGGLADSDSLDEGTHGRFSVFNQLAEDHQPSLIGERTENIRHLHGAFLKSARFSTAVTLQLLQQLAFANLVYSDIISSALRQIACPDAVFCVILKVPKLVIMRAG